MSKALNEAMIPNKFPILVIEELLEQLSWSLNFSKLDLKFRYHYINVRPENVPKTSF